MKAWRGFLNAIVAAILPLFLTCAVAAAEDTAKLDDLFSRLKTAGAEAAGRIESEIWIEWSKSGSPAMDLLLQRGRDAMSVGENAAAIEHFTAIIDQSPDFAEAWNARATAFYNSGDFGPAVADIGRIINRDIARQQIEGGLVFGLGLAIGSSSEYERGLPTARRLSHLNLPLLADCPEIEVELIASNAPSADPGELGVVAAPPAIGNALFSATGLRFRRLPLLSEGL